MERISKRVLVVGICAVALMLLFGGVAHAFIAHEHEGSAWEAHAALLHEQKYLAVAALFLVGLIVDLIPYYAPRLRIGAGRHVPLKIEHMLARGIFSYRRFR